MVTKTDFLNLTRRSRNQRERKDRRGLGPVEPGPPGLSEVVAHFWCISDLFYNPDLAMQKVVVTLFLPLVVAACASSANPKIPEPGVGIEQVVGPADLNYPYGPIEVKYNLGIQNNAPFPITLIRIDVATTNPAGGAYALRRDFYNFKETIPANSTRVIPFWAKAFSFGRGMRNTEPVTLRAIVYFNTPQGAYQKVFIRELSQFPQ